VATGAPGEKKVGQTLDAIPGIMVLHDWRKPRSRSNIDHIAVTSTGVWVIDTKVRPGSRLEFRNKGGILTRDERLIVGGRDETRLVNAMAWQVEIVSDACGDLLGDSVVKPALCFVEATVGFLDRRAWTVRGVVICWRHVLPQFLGRSGPFETEQIDRIAGRITSQLPAA
jgi:hypothetical protein